MLKFTARISDRNGRPLYESAPHDTREAAMVEAFAARPRATVCATGYGYRGGSDIRWHKRGELAE